MILMYPALVIVLSLAWFLTQRQARGLERRFSKVANQASALANQPVLRRGNSNLPDPYEQARKQYQLGQLVQKRDQLEARTNRWQLISERLAGWIQKTRGWQGRKLPYTFGMLDLTGLLVLIEHWGASQGLTVSKLLLLLSQAFQR